MFIDTNLAKRSARYLGPQETMIDVLVEKAESGNTQAFRDMEVIIEHARALGMTLEPGGSWATVTNILGAGHE